MFVYQLLLVLSIGGFLLLQRAKPREKEVFYWAICLIAFLVVALRADNMGGDTYSYRHIFMHLESSSELNFTEPGIMVLNKIIRLFTTDVKVASVIKAFLCLMPIFLFIKRFSSDIFAALFLFFTFSWEGSTFLLEMSAERQCFSMAIFCLFLYLYMKKNHRYSVVSVLCLVLMMCFHYSSALVILLLILDKIHLKRWVLFVSCVVASLSLFYIGEYLAPMLQLADAMDRGFYLSNFEQGEHNMLSLLPFVGSFLVSLYFLPDEKTNTIWFKGYFLATVISAFMMPMGMNISRMCAYFYFGAFISLSWTFDYIKNRIIRYGFMFMVFGYFTYRFMHVLEIMSEVENGMVPYQTFF